MKGAPVVAQVENVVALVKEVLLYQGIILSVKGAHVVLTTLGVELGENAMVLDA